MTSIIDKNGNTIAYMYLTIILDIEQKNVLGLILGNCLFGKETAPIGKFFKDTFRKKDGSIVALLGKEVVPEKPNDEKRILRDAWEMLGNVKDHLCIWIEEKKSWSDEDFSTFLQARQRAAIAV